MKNYTITYAQNREDLILDAFFPDLKTGFYVDIGANHPENDSVTNLFYQKGWHGINVEPTKRLFRLLQATRQNDINLNVGISNSEGELKIREYEDFGVGLSTFSEEIKQSYVKSKLEHARKYKDYNVPVLTLSKMLAEHAPDTIHFMKVDVEGHEYQVLEGNDWTRFRPRVICIEENHIIKDWHHLLNENNYTKVFADGLNEYFVDKDHMEVAQQFSYVQGIIGRPAISPELSREVFRQGAIKKKLEADRQILQSRNNELQKLTYHQAKLLENQQGVKKQLISLLKALDSAAVKRIKKLDAQPTTTRPTRQLVQVDNSSKSVKELLKLAHENDIKNFRIINTHKQLNFRRTGYIVVFFLYRIIRKTGKTLTRVFARVVGKLRRAL